jgi:hypothetical protein
MGKPDVNLIRRRNVTAQGERIFAEALSLPPIERASLIEELLASFGFPSRQEVDAL